MNLQMGGIHRGAGRTCVGGGKWWSGLKFFMSSDLDINFIFMAKKRIKYKQRPGQKELCCLRVGL